MQRWIIGFEDVHDAVGGQLAIAHPRIAEADDGRHDVGQPLRIENHQIAQAALSVVKVDQATNGTEELDGIRVLGWKHLALRTPLLERVHVDVLDAVEMALIAEQIVQLHPRGRHHHRGTLGTFVDQLSQLGNAFAGFVADAHDSAEIRVAIAWESLLELGADGCNMLGTAGDIVLACANQNDRCANGVVLHVAQLLKPVADARIARIDQIEHHQED
jgi:hypothetical protein